MEPIRLGICAPLNRVLDAAGMGYDYIEGNLSELATLPAYSYESAKALLGEASIGCEVFGCLLPREIRVTGQAVNAREIHRYLDFAFGRAAELGAKLLSFSSGSARQVIEGWPIDLAWRQMTNFLRIVERHATDYNLTVALEPINRTECNLLNTVSEAVLLCSVMNLGHIRVLADSYHMAMEHESVKTLSLAAPLIAHVHTANALGRAFPKEGDKEDYEGLFRTLAEAGYAGRVSVEGFYEDFDADAKAAFLRLDRARKDVG